MQKLDGVRSDGVMVRRCEFGEDVRGDIGDWGPATALVGVWRCEERDSGEG